MNALYVTTAVREEDFKDTLKNINPAGQNFHGKLIRALGSAMKVHVFSIVPTALGLEKEKETIDGDIVYSYYPTAKNRYIRALFSPTAIAKEIKKTAKRKKDIVVIYDSLNLTCALAARKAAKALRCPAIAVLTDDIKNITGVSPAYISRIYKATRDVDGAIALTPDLAEIYGVKRNAYVQPILVEEVEEIIPFKHVRPYIYYGGALFEKDGTKDLIDAVKYLPKNYDLIVTGHGPYAPVIEQRRHEFGARIYFWHQVPKAVHYILLAGAYLCVNPRHYNPELDRAAVPSKVMEYLAYGQRVASTLSTPIKEKYGDSINWIEGSFVDFVKEHFGKNKPPLRENTSQNDVLSEFGLQATGEKIAAFLNGLIR